MIDEIMTLTKALITVIVSAVVTALLGAAIGCLLGTFAPAYYQATFFFAALDDQNFDPVKVGIGLGITQGAAAGLAVGILLVAILAWYDLRKCAYASKQGPPAAE